MNYKEQIKSFFQTHDKISNIYFGILVVLIVSIPFSSFGISVSEFSLVGLWFFTFGFKEKFTTLYNNKSALIFISIFLLYLVGMIYTTDIKWGLHSIKIKLPLILFPVVLLSIPSLSKKQIKILMYFLVATIFAKTIQTFVGLFFTDNPFDDIRRLSSISHIRFSLFIVFSIFILIYYTFIEKTNKILSLKYIISKFLIVWLFVFLFVIQSITGIIIFIIVAYILLLYLAKKQKNRTIIALTILIPISILLYFIISINNFYDTETYNFEKFDKTTVNNNLYWHDTTNLQIENGNYVWIYVSQKEMKKNWNKISKFKYDDLDNGGHKLKFTLIRYLTSKHYRKDSVGISQLTKQDILNIENGIANYKFFNKYNLNNRIYKILWQFDVYFKGGNPSGHSVTQRFEFLKTAFHVIQDNPFFGVGTGDIKTSIKSQYQKDNSVLQSEFRKNAHNQYVSFAVTFGIIGAIWISFAIFYPFFKNKKYKLMLPSVLFLILVISMLDEDTWETQISITFFALLYSLFVLRKDE